MEDKTSKINSKTRNMSPEYKAAIATLAHLVLEVQKSKAKETSRIEGEEMKNHDKQGT